MIGDDDFFMQNADYHYGASDAEKLYGRGYDDYNRNLWRDGILMKPPTLEEEKRSQKNKDGAALVFTIVGGGGFIVTLIFMLLIGDAINHSNYDFEGILFFGWIISLIVLFIIFVILYRDNNRMIDEIYADQNVSQTSTNTISSSTKSSFNEPGTTDKKVQKKQTYQKRAVKARNINSRPATATKKPSYNYKSSSLKVSAADKSVVKSNDGNNTRKIVILALVCILIITGIFVLSNSSSTTAVGHSHFIIPDGFTKNYDYSWSHLDGPVDGQFLQKYAAGFEDESQENHIYIMVVDSWESSIDHDKIEYIMGLVDDGRNLDYKKKTINGQKGFLIPKSEDAGYIMNVYEPVYIFVYRNSYNGDIVFVGAAEKSYLYEFIR